VMRSSSALHKRAFGMTWVHSENGKFVVSTTAAFRRARNGSWANDQPPGRPFLGRDEDIRRSHIAIQADVEHPCSRPVFSTTWAIEPLIPGVKTARARDAHHHVRPIDR
jgi:hypothetical protein